MTFLKELNNYEVDLLSQASVREKVFYNYILGRDHEIIEYPDGEIDKVCVAAYTNIKLEVSSEIKRASNTSPIKGLHFSNNLISVIAYSKLSSEIKAQYLRSYYESHSIIDKFLISLVFPEFKLTTGFNSNSSFEKVVASVFIDKDYSIGESFLYTGLEEVKDLIELLVLKLAYREMLTLHPNSQVEEKYKVLAANFGNLIIEVKRRIDRSVNIYVSIVGIVLIPAIIYYTKKYWDAWSLEPVLSGLTLVSPIISIVILLLFNTNPDWMKYIQDFKRRLLVKWFVKRNVSVEVIKEQLNKL